MFLYKLIATFFGIGYIGKGAGTVAALFVSLLLYWGLMISLEMNALLIVFAVITFIVGVFVSGKVEPAWGKDHQRVVIDEAHGLAVSLLFLPLNVTTVTLGLILFRFFDIVKPLYIRRLENLKGGWGVMLDDTLAGVYSNIVLQVISYFYFRSL